MKFIFEKITTIFYYLATVLLLLVMVVFYYNTQKVNVSVELVEHTQDVLHKADNVLLDVLNIETGGRGYVLTGSDAFLEPFNQGVFAINNDVPALKLLTKDNPNQQAKVDSLQIMINERLSISKRLIAEKRHTAPNSNSEIVIAGDGKAVTDQIRNLLAGINSEEFDLLKQRKKDNKNSTGNSRLMFLMVIGFILIICALAIIILKNQKTRNKIAEEVKQSNEFLSNLFDYNPVSITIYRLSDGKIIKVNNSCLQMLGFEKEDRVIGRTFPELGFMIEPQNLEEISRLLEKNKEVQDFETEVKTRRGITKWISVSALFMDVDKSPCLFTVYTDITKRKKYEEQLLTVNKELEAFTYSQKLLSKYSLSLIEASLDPLVTISTEGKITDMNEATVNITGVTRDKLTGTDFFEYFTEPQKAREVYQEVFAKGSVADSPLTLRHKDGKLTDVLFNGSVYKDDQGNVLGVVIVARDVTAQKQASQYARSLIEASLDPLVTISANGKITDVNKASVKVTGVEREDLIGTDFSYYFTDPEKAKEGYEQVFAKGFVADYPLTIRDHKLTDVLFNGSVYKDVQGNVLGAVVVARDTTEQKRIEKELTEAKVFAELATLIAEEAQGKAESATQIAENAVKAKQQFLSNMSHEIRTPMNAIIGFTKVVLKTDLSAKQKEYLTAIKMSGDALIVLINDILDLAKVDSGKMTFEKTPFKMALSLSAMLHLFETKIQEKNLNLVKLYDHAIPEVLLGDPVRLHQIILNLVSNAVKFTAKGTITIEVRLFQEDENKVTLEFAVTDTGIGIAEDKMEKIFDNFQQASSGTSRLYGGTGLGLAIVKQLVESQGGSIEVKSEVEMGSTFSFKLDFQKTKDKATIDVGLMELDSEVKHMKVLVVEDMALNQLLLKTLLDDFGFERDIASNGKIAIEKLQKNSYDIILMDLQMPEMNGFEATEYIRNKMNSTIPIIALTADVTTVDLAKCKAAGMNDYIAKPIDERILYSKMVALVKSPILPSGPGDNVNIKETDKKSSCIDLAYLVHCTKSDPKLMMEMISLYLEQTPPLIDTMKSSLQNKDWNSLRAAVHKMIPSFSIMGISTDFETMAKKVQEYASTQQQTEGIYDMVLQIETVCLQACKELEVEFNIIKTTNA